MRDQRLDRLADVLVRYSAQVRKGDLVCISSDPAAAPLIEAVFHACVRVGANPFWHARSENLQEILLSEGSDEQLTFVSPLEIERSKRMDVFFAFWAEMNTKFLSSVDPHRIALQQSARKPTMKIFMERAALTAKGEPGGLRWCGTLFPTLASAQDAEMSLRAYEDFVFRAGLLHLPDPVAAWNEVFRRQENVRKHLQGKKELRFFVPPHDHHDGTDLRVDVSKATWVNCAGKENFPDGEVFAGPTIDGGYGAEGHVNFTFPAVYQGREVDGVRLRFKNGRVVDASAKKNEDFLIKMLDQDAGARTMGEIAIGTNYAITEFSKNTLFDEKLGGTFHAAVGAGYPESGNTNESGLHWDMVCELRSRGSCPGGTIAADGQVFHQNGRFTLGADFPGN